jgi:hypothetical protein
VDLVQPPLGTPAAGANDSLASWRPLAIGPVGGRLQRFAGSWDLITSDRWVLDTITRGYALEFTSTPPSDMLRRPTPMPADPLKRLALEKEIKALLQKRAVRATPLEASQVGFMSTFFLVPKKDAGSWRPILNLKPLNTFIRPRRFRMDTLKVVLNSIQTPAWAAVIDLKDAYLHIPIRQDHWKFLRFQYQDTQYEFTALPFGLSTSPRVFTRVVKVVGAALRTQGVMIFMYLDDWLIVDKSQEATMVALNSTWRITRDLGFIINTEKSRPWPTQFPVFLGASLNLQKGLACPTEARILNLHQCVSLFLPSSVAPAKAWLKLLGLMASLVDIVDFCRLRMRPIQLHLLSHYQPRRHHIDHLVPTTPWLRPHLRWWLDPTSLIRRHAFRRPRPSMVITTDASLFGWGATLHLHQVAGRWELEHRTSHVNILDMLAVLKALHCFRPAVANKSVLVRCDNSTVVAYINHQGGTRSAKLCALTWKLLHWCILHKVTLSAAHLPGKENVTADALSRGWFVPTEWTLHPQVAHSLFRMIDWPHADLFASRTNHQLPVYCSRTPDPYAWQTDALAIRWDGLLAYAFPPFSLISRVLTKIEEENCRILLIAPFWPRQPWFSRITRLLVHRPVVLPKRVDILRQPRSGLLHPAPEGLHLTCWVLSRNPSVRQDFLNELRILQPAVVEHQPGKSTTVDYAISINGVGTDLCIPLILL